MRPYWLSWDTPTGKEWHWKPPHGRWFITRPKNQAHKHAEGIPSEYRYAAYEAGGHPSGCAGHRGMFYTLEEAQLAMEQLENIERWERKGEPT